MTDLRLVLIGTALGVLLWLFVTTVASVAR